MAEVTLTPEEERGLAEIEAGFTIGSSGNASAATSNDDVPLDVRGVELKTGAENGFGLKCALGQRFQTSATGGTTDAYKAMSRADKALFRKAWSQEEFDKHVKVLKERVVTKSRTKTATMTMVSGRALIAREGLVAFKKYAAKCSQLGAPWVEWDPMWERYTYADITKEYRDMFEQAWKVTLQENSAESAGTPSPAPPITSIVPDGKRRRVSTKSNPPTPLKEVGAGKGDKEKAAAAAKLRMKIQTVQGTARQLQDNIKTAPAEWDWANLTKLKQASAALTEYTQSTTFISSYVLYGPAAEFKNRYKGDPVTMRNEFQTFVAKGEPVVQELSKEVSRLLAMHAANKKATAEC